MPANFFMKVHLNFIKRAWIKIIDKLLSLSFYETTILTY